MTDPQSAPMTAKHLQHWCCPQCSYSITPNEILTERKHFTAHALECVRCLYRTETKATWEEAKAEYTRAAASPRLAGREEIARIIDPVAFSGNEQQRHLHCSPLKVEVVQKRALTKADAILSLLSPAPSESVGWQPIETRPEIDKQPGRQFILMEGSCSHSGVEWYRQHAGEAWIRKPGVDGEMLQYRKEDILRLCKLGDIDPITARVTHWMPGKFPAYPHPSHKSQR